MTSCLLRNRKGGDLMSTRGIVDSKIMRNLLVFSGTLSLIIGLIALIIPVFPTSPFIVLAAFCYLKSSDTLYNWLLNHRFWGKYLSNYVNYHAITKKTRFWTLLTLWISIGVSGTFITNRYARLFLLGFGGIYSIYLLRLNTMPADPTKTLPKSIKGVFSKKDQNGN